MLQHTRLTHLCAHLNAKPSRANNNAITRHATAAESLSLQDKVCVVTGGAGGIGRATALLFASEGAKVVVVDLNAEGADETVQIIRDAGVGEGLAHTADIGDEADSKAIVDAAVGTWGRLDVYFANAGILGKYLSIEETTVEAFNRTLRINALGTFLAIKNASIAMKLNPNAAGGSIVCTASIAAIRADVTPLEYSASKAAVVAMVRSAADRLILDKVRVNAVMPGGVLTNIAMGVATDIDSQV